MDRLFDAVIVGAGQAAALAGKLTGAGWKVALVEKKWLGGTCVNVGCTPTKAMVASAQAAYIAAQGKKFGVFGGEAARVDLRQVKARKDAIVLNFRARNEAAIAALADCTLKLLIEYVWGKTCLSPSRCSSIRELAPASQRCLVRKALPS
jgi:pyruvate/2-oxoglutarate dehydrogenase complex dihydrolipoamide dehydrogenase (E3) component